MTIHSTGALSRLAGLAVAVAATFAGLVAPAAEAATDFCGHDQGHADRAAYYCAQAGDILDVRIGDVHPTQPSLGYDEVYYKLGRYTLGKDTVNKKFADWCEASGLLDAVAAEPGARLDDPTSFTCELQPGQETEESKALMKTVVIGPKGTLWLTDGHHTLTSFYEMADGGADMHVRLLVTGNLSGLPTAKFWDTMRANKWVWLQDVDGDAIKPHQLPDSVGLANFADDKYRSLMYFVRDIGYSAEGSVPFQEFYWGGWLRDEHPELTTWNRNDLTAYLAQVKAVAEAQVALPAGTEVYGGYTKEDLRAFAAVNLKEFAKLSKPYSDAKPGKIAYALEYKRVNGIS